MNYLRLSHKHIPGGMYSILCLVITSSQNKKLKNFLLAGLSTVVLILVVQLCLVHHFFLKKK